MTTTGSDISVDDLTDIDITLMTLRKPTELKKVIDSVPKPSRAVPKNGLPNWYRLGLECKLPVPKMPEGKILFSRGKIGEDVRRIGLGQSGPQTGFDLTDPYCNNVSYDYVPMHDPHLAHFFSLKPARTRMKELGYCTSDGRAVCTLKEFNQYRKYLYNLFMDRIHQEMKLLDERARDDLTLKKVDNDVARKLVIFTRTERAREQLERLMQANADEWAEKKRLAAEQERKVIARMQYLAEYNERMRRERAARSQEKQNRIKQRVQAAAEMELRRKISMVRQWRINEKKRLLRIKQDKEAKLKRKEDNANSKWTARVTSQNRKIQEEALLLKLYTEDMAAGARRRSKRAEIYAYNTDLELQRIRLANWKMMHGGHAKAAKLVKKMGVEFEKSKRGAKGMTPEFAMKLATEAMNKAHATRGDVLMTLGQARARMDIETNLPSPPIKLLEEIIEAAVVEFARRRVHLLLRDVERMVHSRAGMIFFKNFRPFQKKGGKKIPRWSVQVASELARQYVEMPVNCIGFGDVENIAPESFTEIDMKSIRDRPPTPVPSKTKLAEVTFSDRIEDLPDPIALGTYLPERKTLLLMVNTAAKLISRSVSVKVQKGMDITIGKVTLPHMKHTMEWGEAVEGLADAVVNNRVRAECADVRRTAEFLAHRVLATLLREMKEEKKRLDVSSSNLDVKEKRSSTALLLMNPVASGDNVATGLSSAHRLKEETPPLVPCCEGKELQINEDLVRSGLSAISVKHDGVIQCLSMSRACERMLVPAGFVKHRNSFRSLHRPDLKRVPYLRRMTPDELETLFRGYAAELPSRGHVRNNDKETTKLTLPPDDSTQSKDMKIKFNLDDAEGIGVTALHAIPETRSGSEDIPAGMRLHGARARLYTSVLAGAKAGDQLDGNSTTEEYDARVPDDIPEDEVQLHEELQIILPPRCDDVSADSTLTTNSTDTYT